MESENIFIELIQSGEIQIDHNGAFWKQNNRDKVRAEHKTSLGYLQLRKMIDGHRYHVGAHRVVWAYHNGQIPDGHVINHKNGIKDDNRPENLELTTSSENQKHANRNGLRDQRGQRNPRAKLTDRQVAEIRLAYSEGGYTQSQLAERYGVAFQTVSKIVRGDSRSSQPGKTGDYSDRRNHPMGRDDKGQFVGKHKAGRVPDGQEWNEFPEV
ncbi:HNH endonuclease [Solidesulfovibrio alcoholivorans]|uniref:HNH endonuclease n=1 Tax=Solidesulfovibrio alcoholivorans TaxID=81406 RepID=UPI000A01568E|nr:HNH endonuclease [Solidesulfovibrio alcoholivorans]